MKVFVICLTICLVAWGTSAGVVGKINADLLRSLNSKHSANILVKMSAGTKGVLNEVKSASAFATRGARATAVYKALSTHAANSQKNVLELLRSPRFFATVTKVKSFWITNEILIEGADRNLIEVLATLPEVSNIREERISHLNIPEPAIPVVRNEILAEWGIEKIQAEQAWAITGNGTGVIVGVIDTGARYTHEAIRNNYRGGEYSWFNPYNTNSQNPTDGHGHGTHVTGTIGGLFGIGVAPGVQWTSCKTYLDNGSGTESAHIECGQFMACPHKYNGQDPDCSYIPHLVSNSWSWDWPENDNFQAVIDAWQALDITPVFAMGNAGPSCSTGVTPADYDNALGVGSTTNTDSISSFSSRGPSKYGRQKPDISAPGSAIRSAGIGSDTSYASMSGTSMACPHVAGLVGLLKSFKPNLKYDDIKNILQATADRTSLAFNGQVCNGVPDNEFPNYTFGYGRVNALRAAQAAQIS